MTLTGKVDPKACHAESTRGWSVFACALAGVEEMHLIDRDFFRFVRRLVEGNLEVCRHKLRRTEPSPTKSAASGSADGVPSSGAGPRSGLNKRNEDAEIIALTAMNLALRFVFVVRFFPCQQCTIDAICSCDELLVSIGQTRRGQ